MPPINPSGPLPLLVIPGVDPSTPINSQIDQIDQQITFMLQDIDANFARIHHVITEKIIPALKRFDRDTHPVKEASKFWRSFFEAAAQIQVAPGDQSLISGTQTYTEQETAQETISAHDATHIAQSFLGPAVSSTPLPGATLSSQHISTDLSSRAPRSPEEESWAASVESPFTKLDRQLRDDMRLEGGAGENRPAELQAHAQSAAMLTEYSSILSSEMDTPQHSPMHTNYLPPSSVGSSTMGSILPPAEPTVRTGASALQSALAAPVDKGKGKEHSDRPALTDRTNTALLKNVLKANAQRTPRAAMNPFRQVEDQGKKWNGIADLRVPSPAKAHMRTPRRGAQLDLSMDDDSDDDGLPPGMSPPVTMNFTLPAKKLARTPAKEVARLTVEGMTRGLGGDTPSPEEERTTYGWQEPSLAHPTPPRRRPSATPAKVRASLLPGAGTARLSALHPRVSEIMQDGNISFTSSDDSSFEDFGSPPTQHLNYPAHPSASQHEESFDSEGDSFSSIGSAPPGAQGPPLGGRDFSVDDSFSSEDSFAPPGRKAAEQEEETVFGVSKEDGGLGRAPQRRRTEFELLGRDQEDMTVHGGRVQDAPAGESPTPWRRD